MIKQLKCVSMILTFAIMTSFTACNKSTSEIAPKKVEKNYDTAVVSYLGPEGTYTQEACQHFFEKKGSYQPYTTVQEAVDALVADKSTYAVIPQENTIGGAVIDYVDTLIQQEEISVVGEVELPIQQNLLASPGSKLSDIQTVYSHKQGIIQGKDWMEQNLNDVEVVEVSSTAEGAKMVAESNDHSTAAIASAACADVYHLEILGEGIQENDSNVTRFYILSDEEPEVAASDRMVFIASGSANGLPKLMTEMEKEKMTLITIHDRPKKTELGEYNYVIECSDSTYESYCKLAENKDFTFRYLGSFEVKN